MKKICLIIFLFVSSNIFASYILVPMDAEGQKNHLKAYGITYWILEKDLKVKWLLILVLNHSFELFINRPLVIIMYEWSIQIMEELYNWSFSNRIYS